MTKLHSGTTTGSTTEGLAEPALETVRELDAAEMEAVAGGSGYIGAHGRSDETSPTPGG